ncbi:MAG: flagellar hook-length control protein FliK [Armatimonadetes bacterium]|nr:flagellar hook-length control protein FliK [Armatimonadota bacterium]
MSMLAIIQPASAPNPGSVWPGIMGQADKSEFQVKDHAPPGPEPPPPNHLAKGEEASSDKLNASSKKPDSLPEAETAARRVEGHTDPNGLVAPPTHGEGESQAQEPGSVASSQAAAFAAALLLPNPAGLFSVEPQMAVPSSSASETIAVAADPLIGVALAGAAPAEAPTELSATQSQVEFAPDLSDLGPSAEEHNSTPEGVAVRTPENALGPSQTAGLDSAPLDKASAEAGEGKASLADDAVLQKLRPVHVSSDSLGPSQSRANAAENTAESGESLAASPAVDPSASAESAGQGLGEESSNGAGSEGSSAGWADASPSEAKPEDLAQAKLGAPDKGAALAPEAAVIAPAGPQATDATPRTDEAALRPAEASRALHQVADRIEMLAAIRPKDGVTVRLDPEHLGTITIKVLGSAKEVTAELTASNDSVRAALREHSGELTQALSARGVQLQSVQVGSETAAALGGRHQGASQGFDQAQTARFHHGFRREATADGFTLEQARGYARRATGVDVWV